MNPTSLIIGCGFLGKVLAERLRRAGHGVILTTRSVEQAAVLQARFGNVVHRLDVTREEAMAPLAQLAAQVDYAFVLLTPSALDDGSGACVPLQGLQGALDASNSLQLALLSSSTAAYGHRAGAVVTAESPCSGGAALENRLLAIETRFRVNPARRVVRFAGLYGPGRVIGAQALRAGTPIDRDPAAWLNLIHVADAAELLLCCLKDTAAQVELGSDGSPVTRQAYYDHLAAMLSVGRPTYSGKPAQRGGASRRCDPRSTCERTGWRPMFRDFRAGLCGVGLDLIPRETSRTPDSHRHRQTAAQSRSLPD